MNEQIVIGILRRAGACTAGAIVAVLGLVLWYSVKVWSYGPLGVVSIFFMPLLLGLAVGWIVHLCWPEGTFGVAGLAAATTILTGVAGGAMQHHLDFERRLQQLVSLAYQETLDFAKRAVVASEDDVQLRRIVDGSQVAAVGRFTPPKLNRRRGNFWFCRNFIHLNWIAARHMGRNGADKTIWEASRVTRRSIYLDDCIIALAKEPVKDEELKRLREREMPLLEMLVKNKITRHEYEQPLIMEVRARAGWMAMITGGFGPLIGLCTLAGAIIAFKITRSPEETELV